MTSLEGSDFALFMREITGHDPFPWQSRLVAEVLTSGWPDLLDLPTGTGKTTTLLVGLFCLAVAPERMPRRIALIVDRRIIVDQVYDVAVQLNDALADSARPTVAKVAHILKSLSSRPDASPLRVVHLRGGVPRDDEWIGSPDQPTILASTVDQVGSRLLFRGYGVSPCMRPIHAGVLAYDTLLLLDEVHLAAPFAETLEALSMAVSKQSSRLTRPFQVVHMSATPRSASRAGRRFELDGEDHDHPVLQRRLSAHRPAELEVLKTRMGSDSQADNQHKLADWLVKKAIAAALDGHQRIGVVVNRVRTARLIATALNPLDDVEVLLVTGRMRPIDRGEVQARLEQTVYAGCPRAEELLPTIVVATSCIEAGADLDFEVLLTEVASLDALRQRFGRLNRLGDFAGARATIVACSDQVAAKSEDPVYGIALRETWSYLLECATGETIDFGLTAFPEPSDARRALLIPDPSEPPVLLPAYLDLWAETRPAPHPDPDVSLWLHGKDAEPERDAHLVFRCDLPTPSPDPDACAACTEALEFLPPLSTEAVAVVVHELSDWLLTHPGLGGGAWLWSSEGVAFQPAEDLRPGDTVVVPAQSGGLTSGTWDPAGVVPVVDKAEEATQLAGRHPRLRIDPGRFSEWLPDFPAPEPDLSEPDAFDASLEALESWLAQLDDSTLSAQPVPAWLVPVIRGLRENHNATLGYHANGRPRWDLQPAKLLGAFEASTEDVISSFAGIEVGLNAHLQDVRAWAGSFAAAAGLDSKLAADVALAGRLHDIGKADPRFQAMLRGGDLIGSATGSLLAKSSFLGSAADRRRAQAHSGWPSGLRHELISLALLEASPELQAAANDLDLVKHLVASHHGWCRPHPPSMQDPDPERTRVSVDAMDAEAESSALSPALFAACTARFHRLNRVYGTHGLAYLEALLRLGDHRGSSHPGLRPENQP